MIASSPRPNYRFPGEWEEQEAIWFAWPVNQSLWPGRFERVRERLLQLYSVASRYQKVHILCPKSEQEFIRKRLPSEYHQSSIYLHDYRCDDIWIRDYGPLFVSDEVNGILTVADFRFDAWGKKFPNYQRDDGASQFIAQLLDLPRVNCDTVLEGGAIDSNGAGCLLTTKAVLLNPNRGQNLAMSDWRSLLEASLGISDIIWLEGGLRGDDTDGHIDNLARFISADTILVAEPDAKDTENYDQLTKNLNRIQEFAASPQTPLTVETMVMPDPIGESSDRLAASYLNFIFLNGAVLVPFYSQEKDAQAAATLKRLLPGRDVIGIECSDIIHEGGALHCLSQHQSRLAY